MKKWLAWLILSLYIITGCAVVFAGPRIPPAPTSSIYVQDYAGVLSGETKTRINSLGTKLAAKTKAQVVVVTVKSLEGAALEEYSLEILRSWGIGDKQLNNGVLMLVAVGDRKSRIEVGYGLEGALPDAKTGRIQDEFMIPYFKNGDYDKGILNGYLVLVSEVAKEYNLELKTDNKPVKYSAPSADSGGFGEIPWWMRIIIVGALIIFFVFDWLLLGGMFTSLLIRMLFFGRKGGGGGSGGGGFGGGSGGGGGSSRGW